MQSCKTMFSSIRRWEADGLHSPIERADMGKEASPRFREAMGIANPPTIA